MSIQKQNQYEELYRNQLHHWKQRTRYSSDVVLYLYGSLSQRDVVAQLAKATGRHQTEDAAVPGSNPAPPTVT
jgi:hypothetical protein